MPTSVTSANVDLSNCDREQVQFSGAVQPHGCLLVLNPQTLEIEQASNNTDKIIGIRFQDLMGKTFANVVRNRWPDLVQRLEHEPLDNGPVHIAFLSAKESKSGQALNLFAHRSAGDLIVEFETVPARAGPPAIELYSDVRAIIAQLQSAPSLQSFFDLAVSHIKRFTGFERVMVYKFMDDGTGRVIAEAKAEGFAPYLGLHYPASDIPAPARQLFAMSWLRHLPDVDYDPSPIIAKSGSDPGRQVDLSYSILRSVSVMYTGYLQNMGVKSTMVMPLMKNGRLWGLISAMNETEARHVPYEARMPGEFLAHMLSMMMASKEDAESFTDRLKMKAILDQIIQTLSQRPDLHTGLGGISEPANIANYIKSGGAAVVTEASITCLGNVPQEHELRSLATWLGSNEDVIQATDCLSKRYAPAKSYAAAASGLLAIRLSKRRPEYVMWFRPEQAQTVTWAGDPRKPVEIDVVDGSAQLSPRRSFALWTETVQGRSKPWAEHEINAAVELRWAIVDVVLARAEEIELINRELLDANEELDSFSYVASHDLKEPLRGIHHMATFLQRGTGDPVQQTETILRLTKRMDDLIESLLQYSRTGRADLDLVDCDLNQLVDEALAGLAQRAAEAGVEFRRPTRLGRARVDRVRMREAIGNLVSNAIKYNDKDMRWVEIGSDAANAASFYVRDNGIGIEDRHQTRVFDIFRRLHGRDEFGGGTGAGLTIAKKSIERHGGDITIISTPGEGTTFLVALRAEKQV